MNNCGHKCERCKHHSFGTYLGVDFECAYDVCAKKRKEVRHGDGCDEFDDKGHKSI